MYDLNMTLRQIIISAPDPAVPGILACAEEAGATGLRSFAETQAPGRTTVHLITVTDDRQALLDKLQALLGSSGDWRITLLPVETTIPFPEEEEKEGADDLAAEEAEEPKKETGPGGRPREEIYNEVWSQARIDRTYVVFVALSTVVAAFGMIADNVAVVVGAMVIAPLLGPNLAFAVGVALADGKLMVRAAATNAAGVGIALALSLVIGLALPVAITSHELMGRAHVGFDNIAVALASGAAAALSLVTGVSSALVGVMVAVALLPPTAAIGLFLGAGRFDLALGALLLLSVNVTCVNLAAQVVMVSRGITPRTWYEKRKARRSSLINGAIWAALLLALAALLWLRTPVAQ